jgi:small subunit ribosomal protein S1
MANILDKLAEEVDKIDPNKKDDAPKKKNKNTEEKIDSANSEMADILEQNPIVIPQVGDVLEGTVIDISSSSLLLDLGPLGTGVVIGKEIKDGLRASSKVKKGDLLHATLVNLENEDGYIELSIREASYEKAWADLESKRDTQEIVGTKILDANRGGLMVEVNGISGFLPVSQLSSDHYPRVEDGDKNKILEILKRLTGQEIRVKILDVDREAEKLIVSEKAAYSDKEREVISQLKLGDVIQGEISGVVDFGAFVKFLPLAKKDSNNDSDKLEGLVHISELAWQLIDNPREVVKKGDRVEAKIIELDDTRISLSIKALKVDPWMEIDKKYKTGDVVEGKVDKINPFGAFVYLDENIHGLAHISELREIFPDKKIEEILEPGKAYNWKITSIEPKEHRMGLVFVKESAVEEKKEKKPKKEKAEKKPARNVSHSDAGGEKKEVKAGEKE